MRMRKLVWIFIFLSYGIVVHAQQFTISGKIQDSEAKTGIQGATITLRSITDTTYTQVTYTDSAGYFQFDQLGTDSFRLIFTSVGFETLVRSIKVDSGNVDIGNIDVPRTSK